MNEDTNLMMGNNMNQGGGMMQQVPRLPPSLAQIVAQRAAMRMNPQTNPLIGAFQNMPRPQLPPSFPPFQPTMMSQPTNMWQQAFQPSDALRQSSMANTMQPANNIGLPGALPTQGTPQIPNNPQGMGLGANAPQMFNKPNTDFSQLGKNPFGASVPNEDDISGLKAQLFGAYMNRFPQGNI